MKVEEQFALVLTKQEEQSKRISKGNWCLNDIHALVEDLKAAKDEFKQWRSLVDNKVADTHDWINSLHQQLEALKSSLVATSFYLLGD
ncbi:hypothetical protein BDA96_07G084500 [Sorghum bicolor]|uniref:Uncharacterized protein n=1 Tax=Sorghum bicolor TaxID=4558 RepID=A0A921U9W2_SORBI|nr:hypothetical protein BDA96_07G084500 [Sorghum bicolor]